jgi:two-component system chemotaxis response regulator CheB
MPKHDILVLGASAGGVEAIPVALKHLPPDIPATIFVVLHVSADSRSYLPEIIERHTDLTAIHPRDRQSFRNGCVYVAPPDRHLMLEKDCVRVIRGARENRHRPAVDPLFRSAARTFGPRVVGTVLTGALDDGTEGLEAIKKCGGKAIVQQPGEAAVPSMPLSALRYVEVDHVLALAEIGPMLLKLANMEVRMKKGSKACAEFAREMGLIESTMTAEEMTKKLGPPSAFICPDCNGPLWESPEVEVPHYRCLVGHAFSAESLLAGESESIERALWVAVKTLEERAILLTRLSERAQEMRQTSSTQSFRDQAKEHLQHAKELRRILKRVTPRSNGQ